jgi:hypothetical protein
MMPACPARASLETAHQIHRVIVLQQPQPPRRAVGVRVLDKR